MGHSERVYKTFIEKTNRIFICKLYTLIKYHVNIKKI